MLGSIPDTSLIDCKSRTGASAIGDSENCADQVVVHGRGKVPSKELVVVDRKVGLEETVRPRVEFSDVEQTVLVDPLEQLGGLGEQSIAGCGNPEHRLRDCEVVAPGRCLKQRLRRVRELQRLGEQVDERSHDLGLRSLPVLEH